ncbi:ribonuclease H-like domain-containing protein, partial [Tanacetum coccineum]
IANIASFRAGGNDSGGGGKGLSMVELKVYRTQLWEHRPGAQLDLSALSRFVLTRKEMRAGLSDIFIVGTVPLINTSRVSKCRFRIQFDIQTKSQSLLFGIHPRRNKQEELFTHKEEMAPMALSDSKVVRFSEEMALLKRSVGTKAYQMGLLRTELEKLKQEKEGFEFKIEKFDKSTKDLSEMLESQITNKSKKGVGYHAVPSPHPFILNRPTPLDLSYSSLEEFKQLNLMIDWVSDDDDEVEPIPKVEKKTVIPTATKKEFVKPEKPVRRSVSCPKTSHPSAHKHIAPRAVLMKTGLKSINTARPVNTGCSIVLEPGHIFNKSSTINVLQSNSQLNDKGFVDSGCSWYMTRNIAYLSYFKGFEEVMLQLKFNLFSVSQMCDKKNYVLFTDSECLVLSPNFKLPDENQILLKIPRQDNMYSFDMKNIVPKDSLTCLVAKATYEESMLWHRRLGHINFKNINKLVKENLTERKNRTIIEAARTMLADSKLPTTFWAEAVSTACYVHNRVLIVKPHNKTPYELFRGIQGVSESSTSSQQDQDCIIMPIWKDASYFGNNAPRSVADAQIQDKDRAQDENDATEKSPEDSSLEDNGTADQQVNTARPEVNTGSRDVSTAVPEVNTATPEDLVGPSHASEDTQVEFQGIELGNIPQSYAVPTTPHTRIHKDHPIEHVIGDVQSSVQTRRMKTSYSEQGFLSAIYEGKTHQDLHTCLFACFLSQEEPKRVSKALSDPTWVEAMQEELLQFKL